jgi:hypothetical protein
MDDVLLAYVLALANGVAGEMTRRPAAAWKAGVLFDRCEESLLNSVSDYIAVSAFPQRETDLRPN